MAHLTARSGYQDLVERLNKFPQGVAPGELLYKILSVLFTEKEAALCAQLPIRPFTPRIAAARWKMPEAEAEALLEKLAERQILLDYRGKHGEMRYVLPPPVAGFFEFSMMRVRSDVDQKVLAELFYAYITQEDDFLTQLLGGGDTQFGRVLVHEPALSEENQVHVLDYERATELIKSAKQIGVGLCYCRHKASHLGKACDAPQEICMTLNTAAESLIRHGCARRIDAPECLDLLQQAWDRRLVQFAENVQRNASFICNCCGCCCDALIAMRRFGFVKNVTTNFVAALDAEKCTGCGKCAQVCPVEALSVVSAHDGRNTRRQVAKFQEDICLGCGVCVRACGKHALRLASRPGRVITPVTSVHRILLMALERGTLHEVLFDNPLAQGHRAMAAIIGAILRLPPVKRALARKQLQSRYLEKALLKADV